MNKWDSIKLMNISRVIQLAHTVEWVIPREGFYYTYKREDEQERLETENRQDFFGGSIHLGF